MTTYADLASDLLNEAAKFFVKISAGQPGMEEQMQQNAATFHQMADLLKASPAGAVEHLSHAEMGARLLEDASKFFISVAETNPPIQEQMQQNADVFEQVAAQLRIDPEASADNPLEA